MLGNFGQGMPGIITTIKIIYILITISFLVFLKYGISLIELTMLSRLPNMLLRPRVTSIMKKTMEKKVDPGRLLITSVIVMKASPVPPEP